MRGGKVTDSLLAGVVVAAAVTGFLVLRGPGPTVESQLHSEIGRVLARESLAVLRPGGEIVVLTRDTEAFRQPALDLVLRSFEQEVGRHGKSAVTVRAFPLDPLRPVKAPPGDFFELMRRLGPDKAVVSLLGPPMLTRAQRRVLRPGSPRVIAFCPGAVPGAADLGGLLDSGLLQVAVVDRPSAAGAARFDDRYVVLRSPVGLAGTESHANP